jgi:hypothetical protein
MYALVERESARTGDEGLQRARKVGRLNRPISFSSSTMVSKFSTDIIVVEEKLVSQSARAFDVLAGMTLPIAWSELCDGC